MTGAKTAIGLKRIELRDGVLAPAVAVGLERCPDQARQIERYGPVARIDFEAS